MPTSYNSQQSYSYQDHNLVSLATGMARSPYVPAEDLTVCFDGLAVRSPTGSFYSNNGLYSPRQINSPINIGSPQNGYGSPISPVYFGGGCSPQSNNFNPNLIGSPTYNNNNSFAGSPAAFNNNDNSFVGSPNSPSHFLGSPAISPTYNNNELGFDASFSNQQHELSSSYGFTYLSPTLNPQQTQLSPINSPSPTGSYANHLYLFPPTATNSTNGYSRPSSPVPDDVILTASEVNDYMNSPYISPTTPSPLAGQPLATNTDQSYNENKHISEFLFGQHNSVSPLTTADDMELFLPSSSTSVTPSSPHAQPHSTPNAALFFSEDDIEEEDEEQEEQESKVLGRKIQMTTPSGRRAKIHKCPYCPHTSNRANNMREHIQIHNPNRPKPHACKLCNRAFARKHDMNRHYISCKKQSRKSVGENKYLITSPPLNPTT
ncbi:hypothetical protein BD770DRAFT_395793 [Pilaira anomala]|nr:hypothetical protein BD770DRAFT_395793 [Pilaira anomala]